jgi:hypothetical protein
LLWWQLHIAIFNIHQKIVQDKDTISPFWHGPAQKVSPQGHSHKNIKFNQPLG